MSSSLRSHAESLIGRNVLVYHVEGVVYHGTLHSVSEAGIYLANCCVFNQVSAASKANDIAPAVGGPNELDVFHVFFPFFFLPFAVLTGVAAANLARPPYYGYGYPPYGPGYGPGYGPRSGTRPASGSLPDATATPPWS